MAWLTTSDGCQLYYETANWDKDLPILVFFNGTTQTTLNFLPISKKLKDHFRMLFYDARGQGKSGLGEIPLSRDLHVSDAGVLFDALSIEKANLLGISHGGQVAAGVGTRFWEKVNRMIIVSTGSDLSLRTRILIDTWIHLLETTGVEAMVRAFLPLVFSERFLKSFWSSREAIIRAITERNRRESLAAHLYAMRSYGPMLSLSGKPIPPALVISGAEDPLVSEAEANRLATILNGAHRHLRSIGHNVITEAPDQTVGAILEFFLHT